MGLIVGPTPEMGEYSVEVRSKSFVLGGEDNFVVNNSVPCPGKCDVVGEHRHSGGGRYERRRHAIEVYRHGDCGQGAVEILISDIPKIRAVLDTVERIAGADRGSVATR